VPHKRARVRPGNMAVRTIWFRHSQFDRSVSVSVSVQVWACVCVWVCVRESVCKFVFESKLRLQVGGLLVRSLPACIHDNAGAGNQIRSQSEFGLTTEKQHWNEHILVFSQCYSKGVRKFFSHILTLCKRIILITKSNMLERCCHHQDYPRSSCSFWSQVLSHSLSFQLGQNRFWYYDIQWFFNH